MEVLETRRLLAAGDLDPAFGAGGVRHFDPTLIIEGAPKGIAVQTDGKIVAAGTAPVEGGDSSDFGVARYLPDGRPDPSFGDRGAVTTRFPGPAGAEDVLIQNDGRIVVAGYAEIGGNDRFAVARYNPDGSLDASFGGGTGLATVDFWTGDDRAFAVALAPGNKIVLAGFSAGGTVQGNMAFARLNADGSLDNTFSENGKQVVDIAGSREDAATGVLAQDDGRITAGGWHRTAAGHTDFALVRLQPGGTLDATFSGDGKVTADFQGKDDKINDIAFGPGGTIVAAGSAVQTKPGSLGTATDSEYALARFTASGAPDASFGGGDGLATDHHITPYHKATPQPDVWEELTSVRVLGDGRIVAGGSEAVPDVWTAVVARYTAAGARDAAFGQAGYLPLLAGEFNSVNDVAVQTDGKIAFVLSAGKTFTTTDFVVGRANADGTLDTSFGGAGMVEGRPDGLFGEFRKLGTQHSGKVVAVGEVFGPNLGPVSTASRIGQVARLNPDGTLDATFGEQGLVQLPGGDDRTHLIDVAVLADDRILVSGTIDRFQEDGFFVARLTANGQLDTTFGGGDGIIIADFDEREAYGFIDARPDGSFVLAGVLDQFSENQLLVAKFTESGQPDNSFNVRLRPGGESVFLEGVELDSAGRVLVAYTRFTDRGGAFHTPEGLVTRLTPTGQVDNSYGTAGSGTASPLPQESQMTDFLLTPDDRALVLGPEYVNRLTENGADDPAFGDGSPGGGAALAPPAGEERYFALDLQADGKVLAAGGTGQEGAPGSRLAVARLTAGGRTDTAYGGGDGKVFTEVPDQLFDVFDVIADRQGRAVVAATSSEHGRNVSVRIPSLVRYQGGGGLQDPDPDGTLRVSGTAGNDTIVAERFGDAMRVTVNGASTDYDASKVQRLDVRGLAGNDSVDILQGVTPGSLYGGDGNDTLIGSDLNDLLEGGGGSDRLEGRGGSDRFLAKDGRADQLFGGDGPNYGATDPQDQVLNVQSVQGDINLDGSVNGSDFAILAGNFGKTGMTYSQGDLNGDGAVNGSDFAILAGNFGKSAPAPGGGDPDDTFGQGGSVTVPLSGEVTFVAAVDHASGGTVVAGRLFRRESSEELGFVMRLDDAGRPDGSFGDGGVAVSDAIARAHDVVVHPDGKVVVLDLRQRLVRFNADGSLDAAFGGGDGVADVPFSSPAEVVLAPGGKLVVGGGAGRTFAAARYLTTGAPDPSFGGDGWVDGFNGTGQAVAVQPDGKVVVVGVGNEDPSDPTTDAAAGRWNADGTPDASFGGGDGYVAVDLGSDLDSPYSVALDPAGRIVIGTSGAGGLRPLRLTPAGAVDRVFDPVNLITDPQFDWSIFANATLIGPDGRIVIAGSSTASIFAPPDSPGQEVPFLARYNPDGTLDTSFGGGLGYQHALGWQADMLPDGRIVTAGARGPRGIDGLVVARHLYAGETEYERARVADDFLTMIGSQGDDVMEVARLPADPASGRPHELVRVRVGMVQRVYAPSEVPQVQMLGEAGDDRIFVTGYDLGALVNGGDGDDLIVTAGGADSVTGDAGNNVLRTGGGNDVLRAGGGADDFSGGDGIDTLNYEGRPRAVRVTLDNDTADDGEAGENDYARNDIENVNGGHGDDRIFGTAAPNVFRGNGGNDELYGRGGSDRVFGGPGVDALHGDAGDDFLFARDGEADFLAGGFGTDTAEKDEEDTTNGVERFV